MKEASEQSLTWFEDKGFISGEFPYFIEDIISFFDWEENAPLISLNQELETLGWGVNLLNEAEYKKVLFFYQRKKLPNLNT